MSLPPLTVGAKVSLVRMEPVSADAERGSNDDCRRYRVVGVTFDTRNAILDWEVTDDWGQRERELQTANTSAIRMELLAELGTTNGEAKIENYRKLGVSPFTIIGSHRLHLSQVRSAYAHGDFYPALVGAGALGERIYNDLILTLRNDYATHPSSPSSLMSARSISSWSTAVRVLRDWGVIDEETRRKFLALKELRNAAVHFDRSIDASSSPPALEAILIVQSIIATIFTPESNPRYYIPGSAGATFLRRDAEVVPLVARIFLPHCGLVSPRNRFEPGHDPDGRQVMMLKDDIEYPPDPLTDEQFVHEFNSTT